MDVVWVKDKLAHKIKFFRYKILVTTLDIKIHWHPVRYCLLL